MSTIRSRINLELGKAQSALSRYPQQIKNLRQFHSNERAILVTGAPRSGTTWVGRMLSCVGLWHVHEPFNPNQQRWKNAFSYVPRDGIDRSLNRYVNSLLRGGFRKAVKYAGKYPVSSVTRYAPFPVRKVLIKDPHASLLSDYITSNFPIDAIVLFRHPAAFVASVKKLGWGSRDSLKQMMQSPCLMANLEAYVTEIEFASENEGIESLAVLHGVLCRLLWEFCIENETMNPVLFEDLCEDPIGEFKNIFREFQLPYDKSIREQHIEMCTGKHSNRSDSPHNVFRDSKRMTSKWKSELENDEIAHIRRMWAKFQVPLYLEDTEWR